MWVPCQSLSAHGSWPVTESSGRLSNRVLCVCVQLDSDAVYSLSAFRETSLHCWSKARRQLPYFFDKSIQSSLSSADTLHISASRLFLLVEPGLILEENLLLSIKTVHPKCSSCTCQV